MLRWDSPFNCAVISILFSIIKYTDDRKEYTYDSAVKNK